MCFHTCTTFSCGHESLNTVPCSSRPTVRPRNFTDHTSDIILIVMDIVCFDCRRSQLYSVQEEEPADFEEANDSVEVYVHHPYASSNTPTGSDSADLTNDTDTLYGSGYDSDRDSDSDTPVDSSSEDFNSDSGTLFGSDYGSDRDSDSDYNPDGNSDPVSDSGEEFDSGSDSGSDSDSGTYVLENYSDDEGSILYLTFV